MSSPLSLAKLISRIEAIPLSRLEVVGYRSATLQYASRTDLLTGEGSRLHGGRWNPPGIRTVYLSLSPEVAMSEALAHFRYYNLPLHESMPRVFVSANAVLSHVLDITDGSVRQRLRIARRRLLACDWRKLMHAGKSPLTQQVGLAAFRAGIEALLVPSAADPDGSNLAIFPDNLRPPSRIELMDDSS